MRDLGLEVPGTLDGQALQTALEQLVVQLEAAREALRGLQHVYHHAAGMLALLETDGRLLDVNRTALDLIQAQRDDLIGQPFWLTPWWSASPDAQRQLREGIVRAAGGEVVRTQAHLHLPGRHLTVEYTLVPLRRAGEVTGLLAEGRDVTEQARLTQTLAQERAFLNAVLDHMHDGVVACDEQGTLTVFNRATRELHGQPQRPLRPDDWSGAYDLFQEDGRVPLTPDQIPLYRALRGERVQDSLMVIRPAARPPVLVSSSGQALRAQDGTLLGAAVVMRDHPRRPDRPAQPRGLHGDPEPAGPSPQSRGAAVSGPRRLQGHQRHLRASHGRRGAAARLGPADPEHAGPGRDRPAGR